MRRAQIQTYYRMHDFFITSSWSKLFCRPAGSTDVTIVCGERDEIFEPA